MGQRDDEVIGYVGGYRGRRWTKPTPVFNYNQYPLDEDVIDTQRHLKDYEGEYQQELS